MGKPKHSVAGSVHEPTQKSAKKPLKSKTGRKPPNRSKMEHDDVDSLIFLKDTSNKKNLIEIDEKIKLLKTELQSLLSETKPNKTHAQNDLLKTENTSETKPVVLESHFLKLSKSNKDFKKSVSDKADFTACSNSTPSEFSQWLDKTIQEMEPEVKNDKIRLQDITEKSYICNEKGSYFNMSSLPDHKVEELLYKSFLLQNKAVLSSDSEDNASKYDKCTYKINKQKQKPTKNCRKTNRKRLYKNSMNANSKESSRGRKKRLISISSSENDMEIINVNDSSIIDISRATVDCVDLDVTSFDWNEPFDLPENTGNNSDVQIIDSFQENDHNVNNEVPKSNMTELMMDGDKSGSFGESSVQAKRIWECPVCFEQSKGQEVVATQCGHIFCKKCLENHFSKLKKSCPTCRSDLANKPVITLFNF